MLPPLFHCFSKKSGLPSFESQFRNKDKIVNRKRKRHNFSEIILKSKQKGWMNFGNLKKAKHWFTTTKVNRVKKNCEGNNAIKSEIAK